MLDFLKAKEYVQELKDECDNLTQVLNAELTKRARLKIRLKRLQTKGRQPLSDQI